MPILSLDEHSVSRFLFILFFCPFLSCGALRGSTCVGVEQFSHLISTSRRRVHSAAWTSWSRRLRQVQWVCWCLNRTMLFLFMETCFCAAAPRSRRKGRRSWLFRRTRPARCGCAWAPTPPPRSWCWTPLSPPSCSTAFTPATHTLSVLLVCPVGWAFSHQFYFLGGFYLWGSLCVFRCVGYRLPRRRWGIPGLRDHPRWWSVTGR